MPPQTAPWNSDRIKATASAYWQACALHAAVQTGLTLQLSRGAASAAQLAAQLNLDPRGTGILLTALTALGLTRRQGDVYSLDPTAAPFLTPGSERDLTNAVLHMAEMVGDWSNLARCVATGQPVERPQPDPQAGPSPGRTHFYRAMGDLARLLAPGLAFRLGLRAGQRLLDLGGGPGVYGLTFADEVPGLQVTILDLEGARPFFLEEAQRHPRAGQVEFRVGDFHQTALGGPYDVVWLSQVLHGEGPDQCASLVGRAAAALAPGGWLWVQEFVLQEAGGHPVPALFSLNMLVNTRQGRSYAAREIMDWLAAAGLEQVQDLGPTQELASAGLLRGRRPQ